MKRITKRIADPAALEQKAARLERKVKTLEKRVIALEVFVSSIEETAHNTHAIGFTAALGPDLDDGIEEVP